MSKEEQFLKTLDFLIEQSGIEEGPIYINFMRRSIEYWALRCPKSAFFALMENHWDKTAIKQTKDELC